MARPRGVAVHDEERYQQALRSPDPIMRVEALRWLGAHAPGALASAESLLHDSAPAVRAAAAVVLRSAPDPALVRQARLALRDLMLGRMAERHAGLRAAAELASPTLAPRLLPYLRDPDPETRRLALLALAAVPDGFLAPGWLRQQVAPLATDPAPAVRAVARAVLAGVAVDQERVSGGTDAGTAGS